MNLIRGSAIYRQQEGLAAIFLFYGIGSMSVAVMIDTLLGIDCRIYRG
jgi:hypothetical protein